MARRPLYLETLRYGSVGDRYVYACAEADVVHEVSSKVMLYPGYSVPFPDPWPLVMHYGITYNVDDFAFDKHWHRGFDATTCPGQVTHTAQHQELHFFIAHLNRVHIGPLLGYSCPSSTILIDYKQTQCGSPRASLCTSRALHAELSGLCVLFLQLFEKPMPKDSLQDKGPELRRKQVALDCAWGLFEATRDWKRDHCKVEEFPEPEYRKYQCHTTANNVNICRPKTSAELNVPPSVCTLDNTFLRPEDSILMND
jgi:hypothetical protein